jgi:hypothetical protein
MPRYMPDDVFDSCVILALKAFFSKGGYGYVDREVRKAFSYHFRNYENDEFVLQGVVAADRIMDCLRSFAGSEKDVSDYLGRIAICIKTHWPNGTKRKRRFLTAMRRGYDNRPNHRRAETFLANFEGYSASLKDERIFLRVEASRPGVSAGAVS